jgi:hypothetical protein
MRERLDEVHCALGMRVVTTQHVYEFEASPTPEDAVPGATDETTIEDSNNTHTDSNQKDARELRAANTQKPLLREEKIVYVRVLALRGNLATESIVDRRKHAQFAKANRQTLKQWQRDGVDKGVRVKVTTMAALSDADYKGTAVFAHLKRLFYLLPYPALAAQAIGIAALLKWSERKLCGRKASTYNASSRTPRCLKLLEPFVRNGTQPYGELWMTTFDGKSVTTGNVGYNSNNGVNAT